jgi:tetratricopeptide (TPR) repeat protein
VGCDFRDAESQGLTYPTNRVGRDFSASGHFNYSPRLDRQVGYIHLYSGEYDAARQQFKKALESAVTSKSSELSAISRFNLAKLGVVQGHSTSAIPALKEQMEELGSLDLQELALESSIYLAKGLITVNQPADAQRELYPAIKRAEKLGLPLQQAHAHCLMGQALEAIGKSNQAGPHYRKAIKVLDSIGRGVRGSRILERADIKDIYQKVRSRTAILSS